MATLDTNELQKIRNEFARTQQVNFTKTQMNSVSQALETWLTDHNAELSTLIDTTVNGFSNAQKKKIFAEVCARKYDRDK